MGKIPRSYTRTIYQLVVLVAIRFKLNIFTIFEFFKTVRYYAMFEFLKAALQLRLRYLFKSPYQISKQAMQEKGEKEIYVYGETPLSTLDKIAKECRILSKDTVFELGCGRGKTLFWLNMFVGCKTVGIDWVAPFIEKGRSLRKAGVTFTLENLLQSDFEKATVLYYYGSEKLLNELKSQFCKLKEGTRIITVSYPLIGPEFKLEKTFEGRFPWGKALIFLNFVNGKERGPLLDPN